MDKKNNFRSYIYTFIIIKKFVTLCVCVCFFRIVLHWKVLTATKIDMETHRNC